MIKFVEKRYYLDDKRLKELGWCEKTTRGINKIIKWYMTHLDWWGDVSRALVPLECLLMDGVERRVKCLDGIYNSMENRVMVKPEKGSS
eukprot:Gb_37278 [translate_table: standard]